jgi:serine/threonine-protein kinase SRPK3
MRNIVFQLSEEIRRQPDQEIFALFGQPETHDLTDIVPAPHSLPPEISAPNSLINAMEEESFFSFGLVIEEVALIDFGQSTSISRRSPDYNPATHAAYTPPELLFESEFTAASEIWMLACVLFEIRAGYPLFETYFPDVRDVLGCMVETLGKFPQQWWSQFFDETKWNCTFYNDDGTPTSERFGPAGKMSIKNHALRIGESEDQRIDPDVKAYDTTRLHASASQRLDLRSWDPARGEKSDNSK